MFHQIAQMTAFNAAAFMTAASYHGSLQRLMEFASAQWSENTLQRQDASNLLHSAHCKFSVIIRSCFPKRSWGYEPRMRISSLSLLLPISLSPGEGGRGWGGGGAV